MSSQVYVWPWRLSWTAVNLLTLHTFNKSRYVLGSSFIHFVICEWNDSYGIMLLSTGVSWRYKQFETNRFNRKKLHVPPVGITAYYVQYIIHTGLCRVCWLLVWVTEWAMQGVLITSLSDRVSYSDYATGCKIQVSDMRFFSSLKCPDRLWDHPAPYSKSTWILPWG